MTGTIARYFFMRYMMTAFWFLLGVVSVIYLVDFTETSGRLAGLTGYSMPGMLVLTALRVPLILQQTIPFIALFVGMTTLIALNRRLELVVVRAAGISVWQFMLPFCVGAFMLGLGTVFAVNPLAAWAQQKALDIEADWRESGGSARQAMTVPWLRQISGSDDTIIGAQSMSDSGASLSGVVLIHFDADGRIIMRQDAATAKLEDGYWQLNNVLQTRPGEIPQKVESVRVTTNLRRELIEEGLSQPETVAFYELSNKIEAARSFGVSTKALETQFHSLLSLPFMLVAMTLISATVSLKFSRFNQSRSVILGGILSGFVLYVVTVLVKAFGSSGVVPPFIAAWIPVVVALALGGTILLHQEDG